MVKVLEAKCTRETIVGWRKLDLTTYLIGVNPALYTTPEDAKKEVCKLCFMGEKKAKGMYNSLQEKRECDDCATKINRKHSEAKEKGTEFIVEVEVNKIIKPALTAFGRNYDQPNIKGLEDCF